RSRRPPEGCRLSDASPKRRPIAIAAPVMGEEEWQALREPLETGRLTQGPKVAAFEEAFAARHLVAPAVAVSSATAGLHWAPAAGARRDRRGCGLRGGRRLRRDAGGWARRHRSLLVPPAQIDHHRRGRHGDDA